MSKNYVAVRTAYYKHEKLTKKVKTTSKHKSKGKHGTVTNASSSVSSDKTYKSALAEFDHVLRLGKTNSVNVFDEFSYQNVTVSPANCDSPLDAYFKCRDKYKEVTGRNCRNDMNTLFEHVLVLSEEHVLNLENKLGKEKAKHEIVTCLKNYSKQYAEKHGFTGLGFSLHLDEGKYDDNGNFVRNVHAHVMFFNYDFKSKKSNLKHLMKKGKDPITGKTNELNENFVQIQDLAFDCFKRLKFSRGKSKLLTLAKYLPKHQFLQKKLSEKQFELNTLLADIQHYQTKFKKSFKAWIESSWSKLVHERKETELQQSINDFNDQQLQVEISESVKQTKEQLNKNTSKNREEK